MKLLRRREVWVLTTQGMMLFGLLTAVLLFIGALSIYPFLAQNAPLPDAELAIIEGWLPDVELTALLDDMPEDTLYVTTGGPVTFGGNFFKQKTYAELSADRLIELGIPPGSVLAAPAPEVIADRTYASALAARRTLKEKGLLGRPANIYSLGAHSRRSLLLYRFAFGPDAPLGIVALESGEYDLRHWWRSSLAFKHLFSEFTSWLYTQCTRWKYD